MLCSFGLPPSYTSTLLNDMQIVLIKWDLATPPPSVRNRINVSILFSILLERIFTQSLHHLCVISKIWFGLREWMFLLIIESLKYL